MNDFIEEGFEELNEQGYIVDMVSIEHYKDGRPSVIRPAFGLETCQTCGFPKGTRVRFTDQNGYDGERKRAAEQIGDQIITVKSCEVGSWSSNYQFDEVPGRWNTVMFEMVQ